MIAATSTLTIASQIGTQTPERGITGIIKDDTNPKLKFP
jgi:hypothetical protein